MSELKIQEENRGTATILHLKGNLSNLTLPTLDNFLVKLLSQPQPELIILEFSALTNFEQAVISTLQKKAILFSNQARELALVCQSKLDRSFVIPPLMYYPTIEQALQTLQQSQQADVLPPPTNILKLSILAGPCSGNTYLRPGDKEAVIGRHSQCALSLPQDIKVSRFHCKVYEKNGRFVLEDLQSSNGTFFEEQMLTQPVEIKHGDRFQLGETLVEATVVTEQNSSKTPSTFELKLPSLATVEMDTNDEAPTLKYGGMETVIGVSLHDLWSEVLKTPPTTTPPKTTPTIKVPITEIPKIAKLEIPSEDIHPLVGKWDRQDLIDIQNALPILIKHEPMKLMERQQIAGRYEYQEQLADSVNYMLLRCKDRTEEIFIQLTKESIVVPGLPPCHPNLLLPNIQDEFGGKIYRVFIKSGTPLTINCKTLPEFQALQIGILLCDILLSLHEIGQNGFDIGRGCIFYRPYEMPYFALMPGLIYENLSGEDADIFSLGLLLWELVTGQSIPYTAIGNLDQQKFVEQAQQISPELLHILVEIFKRQDEDLEKIMPKLQALLNKRLSPKMGSRKPVQLQICRMGENLVYSIDHEIIAKIAWKPEAISQITQSIISLPTREDLLQIGQKIFREFYPRKLAQFLEKKQSNNISLVLDEALCALPWELAHNGKNFLIEENCLTRKILAENISNRLPKIDCPRFMILSGKETWQQQAKAQLVETISTLSPSAKIKAMDIEENPFSIVQNIPRCDILHVLVDIHYDQNDFLDSGWILEPQRILKLHFLGIAPKLPRCIIVQYCQQQFLTALYSLGIPYVLGSIWPIQDMTAYSLFYQNLLKGSIVEFALADTKQQLTKQSLEHLGIIAYGHNQCSLVTSTHMQ